jgi:hypothetical protein
MYGVIKYPVMAEPPLFDGAVHVTAADELPAVAVPMVGAPGVVYGVTKFDADDAVPVPAAFVAATLNV